MEMEQARNRQFTKHQTLSTNSKLAETLTSCETSTSEDHNEVQKPSSNKLITPLTIKREESPPRSNKPHESVTSLLHTYPQLKIPRSCLKWNFQPAVAIDKDDVAAWFANKRKRDQSQEAQNNSSSGLFEMVVKPVQNCDTATEHNADKRSQEGETKLVKRKLTCSEVPSAKRKVSLKTSEPRRKISSDTTSNCSTDLDKDEPYGHSGLAEKERCDSGEPGLLSHINKSTNVNVCTVCNAVTYSNKEMRLHSRKHTVCPFCKVRFKTLEAKNNHVDKECPIKSIMQNLPVIPLVRAEQDKDLIKQYDYAFEAEVISLDDEEEMDNPEILITDDSDDPLALDNVAEVNCTTAKQESVSSPIPSLKNKTESVLDSGQNNSIEQIDITLDDDIMYISDDEVQPQASKDVTSKEAPNLVGSESTDTKPKQKIVLSGDDPKNVDNAITIPNNSTKVDPTKPKKIAAKLPAFNITNDPYIKSVDAALSEVQLIKTLLRETDKCPGVLPPTNKSIAIQGANDKIYALTNIVQYLRRYKIPVDLSFNSKLTVSYEPFKPPPQSKVELWNPKMARTQRSMIPQSTVNNINFTLPTTNVQTSLATSNQASSIPSKQTQLDSSSKNQPQSTATNKGLPTANNLPLFAANNQALFTTINQTLPNTVGQIFEKSTPCVTSNNVLTAASTGGPMQHPTHHRTHAGDRTTRKDAFQSTGGNSSTVASNPLLNQSLDKPVVDNGVYNSSNYRTIQPAALVDPVTGISSVVRAPQGTFTMNRPRPSVIVQQLEPVPNDLRPPLPSYTQILRPPPPNYRPLAINRFPNRPPTVHVSSLRVKTAEELNKKF